MILRNGDVITPFEILNVDIRIEGERIVEVGENIVGGDVID